MFCLSVWQLKKVLNCRLSCPMIRQCMSNCPMVGQCMFNCRMIGQCILHCPMAGQCESNCQMVGQWMSNCLIIGQYIFDCLMVLTCAFCRTILVWLNHAIGQFQSFLTPEGLCLQPMQLACLAVTMPLLSFHSQVYKIFPVKFNKN